MTRETGRALVPRGSGGLDRRNRDGLRRLKLQQWVDQLPMSAGTLIGCGLAMAALGVTGAVVNSLGLVGLVVTSSMVTMGAGLTFLAANKGRSLESGAPSASQLAVVAERSRRVRAVMQGRAEWTFEALQEQLRWTEEALVSALLAMRDNGEIVEDLNLESGRWVYRLQEPDLMPPDRRSLMLEERKAALDPAAQDSD